MPEVWIKGLVAAGPTVDRTYSTPRPLRSVLGQANQSVAGWAIGIGPLPRDAVRKWVLKWIGKGILKKVAKCL
ncbi:MAG: hypothetical protein BJG00_015965 [Limnothrix sp. CACIAM 69d]|nr:MAG: hypothetical protein BJG00_015965 [Limnothrix sp. CACIAM 69d]